MFIPHNFFDYYDASVTGQYLPGKKLCSLLCIVDLCPGVKIHSHKKEKMVMIMKALACGLF